MSAEEQLAAMGDDAFDAVADEAEAAYKRRTPYQRGYAAGREAHAEDRAISDSLSDLALRTLGRLRANSGATRHNWQAGYLAGLADAADECGERESGAVPFYGARYRQ